MKKILMLITLIGFLTSSCNSYYRETRKVDPKGDKYEPLDKVKPGNNFQNQ